MPHILVGLLLFVIVKIVSITKKSRMRSPGAAKKPRWDCVRDVNVVYWKNLVITLNSLSQSFCFPKSGRDCTFNFVSGERGLAKVKRSCLGDTKSQYQNQGCSRLQWPHPRVIDMQVALCSFPETLQSAVLIPCFKKVVNQSIFSLGLKNKQTNSKCWKLLLFNKH